MSAYDKYHLVEKLKQQGWTEVPEEEGKYMLRPPRELFEKLQTMTFYVYDAVDLQDMGR